MKSSTKHEAGRLDQLLQLLGYTQKNGWISADKFDDLQAHRFELVRARDVIGIDGAFCWLKGEGKTSISAPLVYITKAVDRAGAKAIHRKVWSQGLVPFLIIYCPDEVLICQGFSYSSERWNENLKSISWTVISTEEKLLTPINEVQTLLSLRGHSLRSSVFWREHAIDISGRVDQVVLIGLSELSANLIKGVGVKNPLDHTAANGLIGKMLYLYFLVDRGVINQAWVNQRGHAYINLSDPTAEWNKRAFWKLLDDLDSIFNGSIFPLSPKERLQIDATHIDLAKTILKFGATANVDGSVQLSFIDVDLSVLRVETLSAVYEQFLENVKSGERRKVGAFYTPPFLVDLLLDCLEDEQPFADGITVLDPAAGSGVFLVGAYRRILEHAKAASPASLPLNQVRRLLVRNIFGVERNSDACHVTAFSLYLTMLDYVTPRDLSVVAAGKDPKKLFPPLVGSNLFACDFFSPSTKLPLPKIRCVVGNPPWQTLSKLESSLADQWVLEHPDCPIGKDQAAELFVWKAVREHLAKGAMLAMLIPSKSFVNPTAKKFRAQLLDEVYVTGAINFSHLRYKLFPGARHACAALIMRNRKAKQSDWTWVYAPLSISQPIASKNDYPWTLVMDRAEVHMFLHDSLATNPTGWFDAFVLRPIDRQIKQYISDSIQSGVASVVDGLCLKIDAKHKRGGDSEWATGIPNKYLNGTQLSRHFSESISANKTGDLFETVTPVLQKKSNSQLPLNFLAETLPNFRHQYAGNVLLIPRNFQHIRFIDFPYAYNSSVHAVFFNKPAGEVTSKEKRLLQALERYLQSNIALYFLAVTSTRWLIDRRNFEKGDFGNLPLPFTSLVDPRIEEILSTEESQLDRFVLKAFKLDQDQCSAIQEFLKFRMGFQDGNVPALALSQAKPTLLGNYAKVFQRNLNGLVGQQGTFTVAHLADPASGYGVVAAHYCDEDEYVTKTADLSAICQQAIDNINQTNNNSFTDSLSVSTDAAASTMSIIKPLEHFRWTVDWAYDDSRKSLDEFMRSAA